MKKTDKRVLTRPVGSIDASSKLQREVRSMKPTYSIQIGFDDLRLDTNTPQEKFEAAQTIAQKINDILSQTHPETAGGCLVGDSNSVWNIGTNEGRVRISTKRGEDEKIMIEFFRFESGSPEVAGIIQALKQFQ